MEALATHIDIAFIGLPATLAEAESPDWVRETLSSPRVVGEPAAVTPASSLLSPLTLLSRPELLSRAACPELPVSLGDTACSPH